MFPSFIRTCATVATLGFATACTVTVAPGGGPLITTPPPATVAELQQNTVRAAPFMTQCRTDAQRRFAPTVLTRAQIRSSTTTTNAGSMPSGCTSARPPVGTFAVIIDRDVTIDNRLVWYVDMYYPSNPTRPWRYIVADRSILQSPYFSRNDFRL